MMERFEEFIEDVKKVEIEEEEFKKELKKKLFELYDKKRALRKRRIIINLLSFATIVLIIIIPSIVIINRTLNKQIKNQTLLRSLQLNYDINVKKIIEGDELIEEKEEENYTVKIYKSGIKVYEKEGNFVKIESDDEILKALNINLDELLKETKDEVKILEKPDSDLENVIKKISSNEKYNFLKIENLIFSKSIDNNLIITIFKYDLGNWLLIIDKEKNSIVFFQYPYQ